MRKKKGLCTRMSDACGLRKSNGMCFHESEAICKPYTELAYGAERSRQRKGTRMKSERVRCPYCGHEWNTRAIVPRACPKCKKEMSNAHPVIWLSQEKR